MQEITVTINERSIFEPGARWLDLVEEVQGNWQGIGGNNTGNFHSFITSKSTRVVNYQTAYDVTLRISDDFPDAIAVSERLPDETVRYDIFYDPHKEKSMNYNDFSALIETVKAMSEEEKKSLTVYEDEGIVRVLDTEEEIIFSAYAVNFVHAFFILLGVDVDDNISIK